MSDFRVRVAGDDLVFHAAHFITFENGECERWHGHSYRVAIEVAGPLNASRYVADFVAIRSVLKDIVAELDQHILLPMQHSAMNVSASSDEITIAFDGRRWVFPADNCLRLQLANTTTESLAEYVSDRVAAILPSSVRLRVEIDEGNGCTAICQRG